jgi:hypothetical protein
MGGIEDPLKAATAGALLRLLEPLAQWALEVGIAVGDVQALTERAFVCAVIADAQEAGDADPRNTARIAVRTGLPRSTVDQLLDMHDPHAVRQKPFQNFSLRVLHTWCSESDYLDGAGLPRILPLRGEAPSFQALIKLSVGAALSRTILKDLLRVGAVRRVRKSHVQLVRRTYANLRWGETEMASAGEELREHVRVLLQSLKQRDFKGFHRYVLHEHLPEHSAAVLERDFTSAGTVMFDQLKTAMDLESKIYKAHRGKRSRLSAQITILREPVIEPKKQKGVRRPKRS